MHSQSVQAIYSSLSPNSKKKNIYQHETKLFESSYVRERVERESILKQFDAIYYSSFQLGNMKFEKNRASSKCHEMNITTFPYAGKLREKKLIILYSDNDFIWCRLLSHIMTELK